MTNPSHREPNGDVEEMREQVQETDTPTGSAAEAQQRETEAQLSEMSSGPQPGESAADPQPATEHERIDEPDRPAGETTRTDQH